MKSGIATTLFLATVSAAALTTPANAQTAAPATPPGVPASLASPEAQEAAIVVTGSRVITNGNTAPTPLTITTAEDLLQRAPSSIPDALNQLPQFAGSGSPARNSYNLPGSVQTGNNLNLRNLGPQRVLTLFDGNRMVPSASTGLVDSSLIPQMLISRVEIVTGGASAAYGSDAVSGVVNFVLNKHFNGLSYVAQDGISSRGDYGSQRFGAAWGHQFGRLHIEGSAEYYKNNGIGSVNDRPGGNLNYSTVALGTVGAAGSATNPLTLQPGLQSTNIGFGGYLYANAAGLSKGVLFNPTGQSPQTGSIYAASGECLNCNTATNLTSQISLIPRQQTDQYFLRADLDISDHIQAFAEGYYGHSATAQNTGVTVSRAGATAFSIFAGNPYLPATALAPNPGSIANPATVPAYLLSRVSADLGTNSITQDGKTYGGTLGLTGTLGKSFKWDAAYSYGESTRTIVANVVDNVRLRAAADAVLSGGNVVCRVTVTNPGLYPGCVPINLFGVGSPSAAAISYVRGSTFQTSKFTQSVAEANVRGSLFDLPYGAVTLAVGGASRHQTFLQTSNSDPAAFVAPVGIRGFSGTEFVGVNYGTGGGAVTVNEGYGEVLVPLLKDLPFFRKLDFNAAYRYTDYSTSGGVAAWKAGGVWEPTAGLRFRATKSRDIRAPTLVELFQGAQTVNNGGIADPHVTPATSPNFVQTTSGNSHLTPEKADTLTLGVVFEPRFLPGFSLSVDYYKIKIRDAISSLSVQQILSLCEASNGTGPSCAAITRPGAFSDHTAANAFTAISVVPLNAAETDIAGYDIEANYRKPVLSGVANIRALVSIPTQYQSRTAGNLPFVNYLGNFDALPSATQSLTAITKYHATVSVGFTTEHLAVRVDEEIISPMKQSLQLVYAGNENNIPAVAYTNLDVTFKKFGHTDAAIFFDVANVFDKAPPLISIGVPGSGFPTQRGLYDVVGRSFTVGIRGKF